MRQLLQTVADAAIAARTTPGVVIAAGRPGRDDIVGFGATTYDDGVPVGADTIYDVASLTKPVVTAALLMRLVDRGVLALDSPAAAWLPELVAEGAAAISIAQLAGHASGLPAHVELFRRLWAGERVGAASPYEALIRMAGATPLASLPGATARYSDLGYILLGAVVERAAGDRLDRLARVQLFEPLGMATSGFVNLAAPRPPSFALAAPTERCERRGLVQGEVHDENAHAGGGIRGHAGLFSTAAELSRFARAMAAAADGDEGLFAPAIVRRCFTTSAAPGTTWRLGWCAPEVEPGTSHAGERWPRDGVGHLGFTGTSIWLDPPRRRYCVILSNCVHSGRERLGVRDLRRALMDAVAGWLDG